MGRRPEGGPVPTLDSDTKVACHTKAVVSAYARRNCGDSISTDLRMVSGALLGYVEEPIESWETSGDKEERMVLEKQVPEWGFMVS